MKYSKYRGHSIVFENDIWIYYDTKTPVKLSKDRCCGKCNKEQTKEGHDSCIGTLRFTKNACCGHGTFSEAYIQFLNNFRIGGIVALIIINLIKGIK